MFYKISNLPIVEIYLQFLELVTKPPTVKKSKLEELQADSVIREWLTLMGRLSS